MFLSLLSIFEGEKCELNAVRTYYLELFSEISYKQDYFYQIKKNPTDMIILQLYATALLSVFTASRLVSQSSS